MNIYFFLSIWFESEKRKRKNEIGENWCGDHHGGQICWNPELGPHHKKMLKFKVRKE